MCASEKGKSSEIFMNISVERLTILYRLELYEILIWWMVAWKGKSIAPTTSLTVRYQTILVAKRPARSICSPKCSLHKFSDWSDWWEVAPSCSNQISPRTLASISGTDKSVIWSNNSRHDRCFFSEGNGSSWISSSCSLSQMKKFCLFIYPLTKN